MTDKVLDNLLSRDENSTFDFKEKYDHDLDVPKSRKDLAVDICAIANHIALNGGKGNLLIGIEKETKRVIGVDREKYSEERIQNIICDLVDPPPIVSVDYISKNGKTVVLITVDRNITTLYQVIKGGFPIRRGSTTGYMKTIELVQAIKNKINTINPKDEYESLGKGIKSNQIRIDIEQVLTSSGFDGITNIKYEGLKGGGYIYYPCDFIAGTKSINGITYNFLFCSQEPSKLQDLRKLSYTLMGYLKDKDHSNIIFIPFYPTMIATRFFSEMVDKWKNLIQIPITPSIKYLGFGENGEFEHLGHKSIYVPKFFSYKVKSQADIETRLETILEWMNDHKQLLADTHESLKKPK